MNANAEGLDPRHPPTRPDLTPLAPLAGLNCNGRLSAALHTFLNTSELPTPYLVVDANVVQDKYRELHHLFPQAQISYAVQANPHPTLLSALHACGAHFNVASWAEIEGCLRQGIPASQLSYGNPIKKASDLRRAFEAGVRLYTFDSEMELEKIAAHAPGARVVCRLLTPGADAGWPLSRKFGCEPDMALELLTRVPQLGLEAAGLSFHVGSQQMNPRAWDGPIAVSALLFRLLADRGVYLTHLNLGGGFPAHYRTAPLPLRAYQAAIQGSLQRHFGAYRPQMIFEPGRSLVADAGVLETEVILVSRKSTLEEQRWVYLDIGRFGGLAETLDERIRYAVDGPCGGELGPVVLAGPTGDSADILYERMPYELPLALQAGDRLRFYSAGAYTSASASAGSNGLATHVLWKRS